MITAGLAVTLLVAREVVRSVDRDHPAVEALGRLLVPVAIGAVVVLAVRFAQVVA